MKKILAILKMSALIIFIFILHLLLLTLAPYPLKHINLLFLLMLWLVILRPGAETFWAAFFLGFLLELYTSAPFGLNIFALLVSLFAVSWFLNRLFTNHTVYIVFFSCFIGTALYRLTFIIWLVIVDFNRYNLNFSWPEIFWEMILEVGLTSLTTVLLYLVTSVFWRRLNPNYINEGRNRIFL